MFCDPYWHLMHLIFFLSLYYNFAPSQQSPLWEQLVASQISPDFVLRSVSTQPNYLTKIWVDSTITKRKHKTFSYYYQPRIQKDSTVSTDAKKKKRIFQWLLKPTQTVFFFFLSFLRHRRNQRSVEQDTEETALIWYDSLKTFPNWKHTHKIQL